MLHLLITYILQNCQILFFCINIVVGGCIPSMTLLNSKHFDKMQDDKMYNVYCNSCHGLMALFLISVLMHCDSKAGPGCNCTNILYLFFVTVLQIRKRLIKLNVVLAIFD